MVEFFNEEEPHLEIGYYQRKEYEPLGSIFFPARVTPARRVYYFKISPYENRK